MAYKICKYCGKGFEPSTSSQKYCSRECSIRIWNKKSIEKIRAQNEEYTSTKGKSLLDWCNENGERGSLLLSEYSSKNEQPADKIAAGSGRKFTGSVVLVGLSGVQKCLGEQLDIMDVLHVLDILRKQITYIYGAKSMESMERNFWKSIQQKMRRGLMR